MMTTQPTLRAKSRSSATGGAVKPKPVWLPYAAAIGEQISLRSNEWVDSKDDLHIRTFEGERVVPQNR